jgi:hypothetical protein
LKKHYYCYNNLIAAQHNHLYLKFLGLRLLDFRILRYNLLIQRNYHRNQQHIDFFYHI